jgi:hypothetical protein
VSRAAHCDECKHFDPDIIERGSPCVEGHKPRFYPPKSMHEANFGWYGWKRKCEDFAKETEE